MSDNEDLAPSVRLPPKRELAAQLIAKGWRQTDTARDERINVTKQTMGSWVKEPDFQRRVNELRTNNTRQVDEILAESATDAAKAVVAIMKGDVMNDKLATSRLKAALFILDRLKPSKLPAPKQSKQVPAPRTDNTEEEDEDEELARIVGRVD